MAAFGRNHHVGQMRWTFARTDPNVLKLLETEAALSPLLARSLASRGFTAPGAARSFLDARLGEHVGDPFALKDMDRAADRLAEALSRSESIAIFGDYDVDGITATVLLLRLLQWLKVEPHYYIPHRIDEGYGLNREAIDVLAKRGTRLLVTVDNGISSVEEVDYASSLGLDCIITDHHQLGPALPRAQAVVDPNRTDCTYGFRDLSGVGVAFKLAHAVLRRLDVDEREAKPFLTSLLDIVALGTIADVVPLVGENRALARAGLAQLEQTRNPGLAALLQLVCSNQRPLQAEAVTFGMAPRLNAAGRTEHASLAVDLLTTNDPERAMELAHQLDELNNRRRAMEQEISDQALRFIPQQCDVEDDRVYVVLGRDWHLGVVGIVASKLSDRFGRTVVVLSDRDGVARGSARSVGGFDIHAGLSECAELLLAYGGHPQAAGLTLPVDQVDPLRKRINAVAAEWLGDEEYIEELAIDAACEPDELSLDAVEDLSAIEPCGHGNPRPVFALLGTEIIMEPRIVGTNHLKLAVAGGAQDFSVIGFRMAGALEALRRIDGPIDIAFRPTISDWGGTLRVELQLCDFRPSSR